MKINHYLRWWTFFLEGKWSQYYSSVMFLILVHQKLSIPYIIVAMEIDIWSSESQ